MRAVRYTLAWLLCAAALSMVGCNSETAQIKAQAYAATTLASSYRMLGKVDEARIGQIKAMPDPISAAIALKAHGQRYDIVKATLAMMADLVDKSVADGMSQALIAPLLSGAAKVIAAIEALQKGGP